jgi:hypothetical protein
MTGGFGREAATLGPKIDFKQGSKLVVNCLFKFYHDTTPTIYPPPHTHTIALYNLMYSNHKVEMQNIQRYITYLYFLKT